MGFRFRKSANFGPLRVNLSKSGVGYSVGGKGFRVTKKANGGTRTTASIPGTGISYVKETSGRSCTDTSQHTSQLNQKSKWPYALLAVAGGLWVIFFILFFITSCDSPEKSSSQASSHPSASSAAVSQQEADPTEAVKADALDIVDGIFSSESISSVRVSDVKIELYVQNSVDSMDWDSTEQAAQEASTALMNEVGLQYAIVYVQDESGNNLLTTLNGETTYNINTVETVSGPNPSTISLAEFEAIQTGMEYQEVFDIIGGRGTMLSEVDMGLGDEYYTVIYQWEGEGFVGANANVTFQGGVVISKAQFGLE
ncbi:MAG: DUF4236 domain-containing protein [Lawsonibacter sp.]|jgi:hypothetical protein